MAMRPRLLPLALHSGLWPRPVSYTHLLADSEETYSFLRQILTAASAPYRSKRIHIGMDEAHGVGMGAHLRLHGYETVSYTHLDVYKRQPHRMNFTMCW